MMYICIYNMITMYFAKSQVLWPKFWWFSMQFQDIGWWIFLSHSRSEDLKADSEKIMDLLRAMEGQLSPQVGMFGGESFLVGQLCILSLVSRKCNDDYIVILSRSSCVFWSCGQSFDFGELTSHPPHIQHPKICPKYG